MPDPISWEFAGPYFALAFIGGYLLGSVPFGLVLTRLGDASANFATGGAPPGVVEFPPTNGPQCDLEIEAVE